MADIAVNVIADFINSSGKEATIAKYGTYADEITKI